MKKRVYKQATGNNTSSGNCENSNEVSSLKQHMQSLIDSKNKLKSQPQIERKTLKVCVLFFSLKIN